MSRLRPYQSQLEQAIYREWNAGHRNVIPQLATGGGKTVIIGAVVKAFDAPTVAIAHRQELVSQISIALGREGIRHSLLAPSDTVKSIVAGHMDKLGRSFYDPVSNVRVGGVDTIVRMSPDDPWFKSVALAVQDEGHHVLADNKWGRAMLMFPNAFGLFPTATPGRADGRGLGRATDGLADALVNGPSMRDLIRWGYLTDYRIVCAEQTVDLSTVAVSEATGDFNQHGVRKAVHASTRLVGDVVKEYLRWAGGKLGVTFAVDVESATEIANAFRAAGIPAEVVHAKTPDTLRRAILRRFENREILQLVNVDLFGEGFDLPAIEVVSMARPTQSFPLYAQQFGRSLRLMISEILQGAWDTYTDAQRLDFIAHSSKPKAMIIDHVGNVERHGLPDRPREWSLDRRERRSKNSVSDAIPLRVCVNPVCSNPYERIYKACPYCGVIPEPADRRSLVAVDGDLNELDPAVLAAMREEVIDIEAPIFLPKGMQPYAQQAAYSSALDKRAAQRDLRHAIGSWAAVHSADEDSTNYRRFFHLFGVDVLTAQSYGRPQAEALVEKIAARLALDGFVISVQTPPEPPSYQQSQAA